MTTVDQILEASKSASPPKECASGDAKPREIKKVAIYCGSSNGNDPVFLEAAGALGAFMADNGIEIVYGGGNYGLMGEMASSALKSGGKVHGWIPKFLTAFGKDSDGDGGLTTLTKTEGLKDRKMLMFEASDAFICLPGGPGTLDEFAEVLCWAYITMHDKPIGLVDVKGYWKCLDGMFDKFVSVGFAPQSVYKLFARDADIPSLWSKMVNHKGPDKWYEVDSLQAKRAGDNVPDGYSCVGEPCKATPQEEVKTHFDETGKQIIKRVAVFLGSSTPSNSVYIEKAKEVGNFLAGKGVEVVYGAGNYGSGN